MRSDRAIALLVVSLIVVTGPCVLAGSPPASCTAIPGCPLTTDLVLFGEGLPGGYEIGFRITGCTTCSGSSASFLLGATMEAEFGPYATGSCNAGDDLVTLDTSAGTPRFTTGTTTVPEQSFVPLDGSQTFTPTLISPLRTACADAANLDYRIPRVQLSGNGGARTQGLLANRPRLWFPLSVRSTDGLDRVLPHFDLRQDLSFGVAETLPAATTVRVWPDGLPFELGPLDITYAENRVDFTTPGQPIGPPAYTPAPPDASNIVADPNLAVVGCMPLGDACTDPDSLINDGYLLSPFWVPAAASFDVNGLDVTLELGAANLVTYEPAFPRGVKLTLNGVATVTIDDSEVSSGGFFGGTAFFRYDDNDCISSTGPVYTGVTRTLSSAPLAPELLPGGALVAGVTDLNQNSENLTFTYNEIEAAECGTLFVPPPLADKERNAPAMIVGPQYEWLAAADLFDPDPDEVLGRGLYAGINYNRDGVCVGGALDGLLCTADAGCDPGGGGMAGTCDVGRWSPKCGGLSAGATPTWHTGIQNVSPKLLKTIVPADDLQSDREMAFLVRQSGFTGVFDAGNDDFTFQPPGGFQLDFDKFGWAFLDSQSCPGDTITSGGLVFPWPAAESITFADMKFCDCSALKTSRVSETLTEHRLGYWDAPFKPYNLYFSPAPDADCELVSGTGCLSDALNAAATACIDAITPIQHLSPEPLSTFGLRPDGVPSNGGEISFKASADFEFEQPVDPQQDGYAMHMEQVRLTEWDGASEAAVGSGTHNYGCYNATAKAQLPYFGETEMGVMVGRAEVGDGYHSAQLHEAEQLGPLCNPGSLAVPAGRQMGAGCVDLSQNLCYVPPQMTAAVDGSAASGRGIFVGYASDTGGGSVDPADIDFGAVGVAVSTTIDGEEIRGDVGAGAPLAPYAQIEKAGLTGGLARAQIENCIPSDRLNALARGRYDTALAKMGGLPSAGEMTEQMHESGAMKEMESLPDSTESYRVVGPSMQGERFTGALLFDPERLRVEQADMSSDLRVEDGNRIVYRVARAALAVSRFVKKNDTMIIEMGREVGFGPMELAGDYLLDIRSPPQLDYDLSVQNCQFGFHSLTGSFHLGGGGLSSLGFPEVSATHYWDSDGNVYLDAAIEAEFLAHKANGAFFAGRLTDISLMQNRDPEVASFLGDVPLFIGAYASGGAGGRLIDVGCLLRVDAGGQVAGWYNAATLKPGAKLRGWVSGTGGCLVDVRGDLSLVGSPAGFGVIDMQGSFWVAGGLGFCEEDEWDTPQDVLNDKFCTACVISNSTQFKFSKYVPVPFLTKYGQPDAVCK